MSDDVTRGRFTVVEDGRDGETLDVHFNPESIELAVSNSMDDNPSGDTTQFVSQTTAKLSLALIFDTTHSGADVRDTTVQLIRWMGGFQSRPADGASPSTNEVQREPKVLRFDWGAFTFKGFIDSYKEVIDLFSREGVPLRSTVTLSMTQQAVAFTGGDDPFKNSGVTATVNNAVSLAPGGGSPSDVAGQGGDPSAARGIAAQNGLESLRGGVGGSLTVSAGVGASAGLGLSVGAGSGLSAGAAASTRSGAAAGAFAGLRSTTSTPSLGKFKAEKVQAQAAGALAGVSTSFAPGGRADGGPRGLSADVGQRTSLAERLRFGEEP